jgi:hypothetical protein
MNVPIAAGIENCPKSGTKPISPPIHHSIAAGLPVKTNQVLIVYGQHNEPTKKEIPKISTRTPPPIPNNVKRAFISISPYLLYQNYGATHIVN